jgi:hypothetical protein
MASIKEQIKATGKLNILVTGPDGKVKQDLFVPNLVVAMGKNYIATRMKDNSNVPNQMSYMAVGQVSEAYNWGTASTVSANNTFVPSTYNTTLASEISSLNGGTTGRQALTTAGGAYGTTVYTAAGPTATTAATSLYIAAADLASVAPGMYVHGAGVPQNTRIASSVVLGSATNPVPLDFSLTSGITASANVVTAASGQANIVVSSIAGTITPGMLVTGSGSIPSGTTVSSWNAGTLTATLSANLTGTITSTVLTFTSTTASATSATAINPPVTGSNVNSVSLTAGSKSITVTSATGIQVGMRVRVTGGTGTLDQGCAVYSISGSTITLTSYALTTGTANLTFDNPLVLTNANTITYASTFSPGQGTGAIVEAGIFNASDPAGTGTGSTTGSGGNAAYVGGAMLCRTTFPVVTKGADDTMSITWTVTIS